MPQQSLKVFPGGNVDVKQDSCLQITAIRETFEESGMLVACQCASSWLEDFVLDEARQSIHAQRTNFQTFLADHHLTADMSSLLPFTTWVTPASARRSDAFIYVHYVPLTGVQTIPCPILCSIPPIIPFSRFLVGRQVRASPHS